MKHDTVKPGFSLAYLACLVLSLALLGTPSWSWGSSLEKAKQWYDLGYYELSFKAAEAGLVDQPKNPKLLALYGWLLLDWVKDYEKAIKIYDKLIQIEPDSKWLERRGLAYGLTGHVKKALADFEKAKHQGGDSPTLAHNLQNAQEKLPLVR